MIKTVCSFGFGCRKKPAGMKVYDARQFRNPHSSFFLHGLDGTHPAVRKYVLSSPGVEEFISKIIEEGNESVAIGCYGGIHRSVAIAEEVARRTGAVVSHKERG